MLSFDTLQDLCSYFYPSMSFNECLNDTFNIHGQELPIAIYKLPNGFIFDSSETVEKVFSFCLSEDTSMQVLLGRDITVASDVVLTPPLRCKGLVIFNKGVLTNNGTISMTARGCAAEGQDIYLSQNTDLTYEFVPAIGAAGTPAGTVPSGTSGSLSRIKASDGVNRQTGGGGRGHCISWRMSYTSSAGGAGTSFSGGAGGGSISQNTYISFPSYYNQKDGSSTGGAGGAGYYGWDGSWAGQNWGGVGNPGGIGYGRASGASNYTTLIPQNDGTGGLLVVYTQELNNLGLISSDGIAALGDGGDSGGGSVNIYYCKLLSLGTTSALGGGSYGGNGTVTLSELFLKNKILFIDNQQIKYFDNITNSWKALVSP